MLGSRGFNCSCEVVTRVFPDYWHVYESAVGGGGSNLMNFVNFTFQTSYFLNLQVGYYGNLRYVIALISNFKECLFPLSTCTINFVHGSHM